MVKYIMNDHFVDQDKAFIHVSDLTLLRGYGVFDFFRLSGLTPLFIDDHLERFFNSAEELRLTCPVQKTKLRKMILELIQLNKMENSGMRLLLTGGESSNGYFIGNPTLIVINEPLTAPPEETFTKGIKIITHEYQRDIPIAKTTNYIVGIYHLPKTVASDAADMLYHWNGKITELTRSNIFIVKEDQTIVTPKDEILKGITRKKLIDVARENFIVEERDVYLDELFSASEAFITGTNKRVTPVRQVDDRLIGDGQPGTVTMQLQIDFEQFISVEISRFK